jgi:[CysO sulfur-carrier protein]-S-L-cysteine hydrolase
VRGLFLPEEISRRLLALAASEAPYEACALLGGDRALGLATTMHPARNALASPYRYEVDPGDLVRIVHEIERQGDDLVAIFHSHPAGPAALSPTDVREARYAVVQLLAGPSRRGATDLSAWRIDGREAVRVPLTIGDPGSA